MKPLTDEEIEEYRKRQPPMLGDWSRWLATVDALRARLAEVERERDAYRKAKAENDDRFMRERDEARRDAEDADLATHEALRDLAALAAKLEEVRGAAEVFRDHQWAQNRYGARMRTLFDTIDTDPTGRDALRRFAERTARESWLFCSRNVMEPGERLNPPDIADILRAAGLPGDEGGDG